MFTYKTTFWNAILNKRKLFRDDTMSVELALLYAWTTAHFCSDLK